MNILPLYHCNKLCNIQLANLRCELQVHLNFQNRFITKFFQVLLVMSITWSLIFLLADQGVVSDSCLLHVLCKALCIYNSRLIYDLRCNHCMFFVALCWVCANMCYLSRKLLCLYRILEFGREEKHHKCFAFFCSFFDRACVLDRLWVVFNQLRLQLD